MEFTTEQIGALAPTFREIDSRLTDQSKTLTQIKETEINLAREIHETLRYLGDKYIDVEKITEKAQHEATRATDAANDVETKMKMCREDEPDRVEAVIRKVMPEILKREVPMIMNGVKQKTDWAKNLSMIIAATVLCAGIIGGANSFFGDKERIVNAEITQKNNTTEIEKVKGDIVTIKETIIEIEKHNSNLFNKGQTQ